MANQKQVKLLLSGVEHWNDWRREHQDVRPDLTDADLQGADLRSADLRSANLQDVKLQDANLRGANLRGAKSLTPKQLAQAHGDATTELPKGSDMPSGWAEIA